MKQLTNSETRGGMKWHGYMLLGGLIAHARQDGEIPYRVISNPAAQAIFAKPAHPFGLWQNLVAPGKTQEPESVRCHFEAAWAGSNVALRIEDL